jgi:hypothetical protein
MAGDICALTWNPNYCGCLVFLTCTKFRNVEGIRKSEMDPAGSFDIQKASETLAFNPIECFDMCGGHR